MTSMLLLFSLVRRHHKVHLFVFGGSNLTRTHHTSGFSSVCSVIFCTPSPGCHLPFLLPSFSLVLFLTCSVPLILFLFRSVIYWQWIRDEGVCRRRDGNIQGNGCFRPDFITSGWEMVGRNVCVCACEFLCVCAFLHYQTIIRVHYCKPQPLTCA